MDGISQPSTSPVRLTPSSSVSTERRRAFSIRCLNTFRTNGSRSRWPACTGAGRPASRYRASISGQSNPRPLYETSQASGVIHSAISARSAGSSAWSGSRSWVWRKWSPSQRARPTRNASVPAAVARPVVSVSRQTSGASAGGWPGRRASRSRSSGISTGATTRRTMHPAGVSATSAPRAAARRAASTGLRRPESGARAGAASGPSEADPPLRASVARRFASRRSRVTPGTGSVVMPRPPRPQAPWWPSRSQWQAARAAEGQAPCR